MENNKAEFYYKIQNNIRIYYASLKQIGTEFEMVKYLISSKGISSSKAHKVVRKMKEVKDC